MAWHSMFTSMASNLGMGMETILLMLVVLGCIIFMARDFKLGIIIMFILTGCLAMFYYFIGVPYKPALVVFFMSLVIMAFSLYAVAKTTNIGIQ